MPRHSDVAADAPPSAAWVLRVAAVDVALVLAHLLATLGEGLPNQPEYPWRFARALVVTVPLQAGLFWAASARSWHRLVAGLLMVPCALLLGGFAGEVVQRMRHGWSVNIAAAITFFFGIAAYAWGFVILARKRSRSS